MFKLIVGILVSGFAVSAFAVDSGCGLGSLALTQNSKLSQILAVTTNSTTLTNLFGITSGTSGCSASGFAYQEKEATIYAEANMPSLKVEMARGQGESLSAFSQVLGCSDAGAFGQMTKSKYQTIFPSSDVDAHQMLSNVKAEIQKDASLQHACGIAG